VQLPMNIHIEPLKGAEPFYAIMYGPILLAQRNGTRDVPWFKGSHQNQSGLTLPIASMPFLNMNPQELPGYVKRNPGNNLSFRITPLIPSNAPIIELVPFNEIYEERYTMYFPVGDETALRAFREIYKLTESADTDKVLDRALDYMKMGWQQPETDHNVKLGKESWAGYFKDEAPYRSAKDWFSAEFTVPVGQFHKGLKLSVFNEILGTCRDRGWEIAVNGKNIATANQTKNISDKFEILQYPIPQEIVDASNGIFEIKIVCRKKEAGPIFKMGIVKQP
jgi:Domain of unknown function